MSGDCPTVCLLLESKPQTLALVRGMLGGLAESLALDPELLDDLKTSVSEACNNVVLHAYDGVPGPMEVRLFAGHERIRVTVRDAGVGLPSASAAADRLEDIGAADRLQDIGAPSASAASDGLEGIGLSVIRALTETAQFTARPGGGTEVQMDFAGRRDDRPLFRALAPAVPDDGLGPALPGEVVVSLSPVTLLAGVLGRLARILAATARFSLDRFSDVYLVTDLLAAHAAAVAAGGRVEARMIARDRRLELAVGPFRRGTGANLRGRSPDRAASPLVLLADRVSVEPVGDADLLHVVVIDHRRS